MPAGPPPATRRRRRPTAARPSGRPSALRSSGRRHRHAPGDSSRSCTSASSGESSRSSRLPCSRTNSAGWRCPVTYAISFSEDHTGFDAHTPPRIDGSLPAMLREPEPSTAAIADLTRHELGRAVPADVRHRPNGELSTVGRPGRVEPVQEMGGSAARRHDPVRTAGDDVEQRRVGRPGEAAEGAARAAGPHRGEVDDGALATAVGRDGIDRSHAGRSAHGRSGRTRSSGRPATTTAGSRRRQRRTPRRASAGRLHPPRKAEGGGDNGDRDTAHVLDDTPPGKRSVTREARKNGFAATLPPDRSLGRTRSSFAARGDCGVILQGGV